jgi:hypothetical protein
MQIKTLACVEKCCTQIKYVLHCGRQGGNIQQQCIQRMMRPLHMHDITKGRGRCPVYLSRFAPSSLTQLTTPSPRHPPAPQTRRPATARQSPDPANCHSATPAPVQPRSAPIRVFGFVRSSAFDRLGYPDRPKGLRGWACASLTSKTISQAERTATTILKKVYLFS